MASVEVMRALLARIVDDAGLFPPARLPMPDALAAHRVALAGPQRPLMGRFLVPASRLEEFTLAAGRDRPELGVIVDTAPAGSPDEFAAVVGTTAKHEPTSVELQAPTGRPLPQAIRDLLDGLGALPTTVATYVELPRGEFEADWPQALHALGAARTAGRNIGAKLRCAAAGAHAAPSESDVAAFIIGCHTAGTPFKATAGLHHAVRRTAEDGAEEHGFLNLLTACAAALAGADRAELTQIVGERDPAVVAGRLDDVSVDTAVRIRAELLVGFGCCDPAEPFDDLQALDLLRDL